MNLEQFTREFTDAIQADPERIKPDMRLEDIDEYDSMGRMCIMSMIDTRFGFVFPVADLNKCKTINEIYEYVQGRSGAK